MRGSFSVGVKGMLKERRERRNVRMLSAGWANNPTGAARSRQNASTMSRADFAAASVRLAASWDESAHVALPVSGRGAAGPLGGAIASLRVPCVQSAAS